MINQNKLTISGKRKTAVAKATIYNGTGKVFINNIPKENLDFFKRLIIEEPIEIFKKNGKDFNFDIDINVKGGGSESRIEASRLAIARGIVEFIKDEKIKKDFMDYDKNLLIADTRRKEACKPGDSKARRKRQKSFR
ncbi:MAG: 30S ribosomal protein S9 [Nanoarchaeota archaeon]